MLELWIVLFSRDGESADFRRDFIASSSADAWRKAAAWFRRKHPGKNIAIAVDRIERHPRPRMAAALAAARMAAR